MKLIDEISKIDDLIIELQVQLNRSRLNKDFLIREAFTLWYVLVEGEDIESFSNEEIETLLRNNYLRFQSNFKDDADYCFIMGWMISITFWYFDPSIREDYGNRLLINAYRSNPKNSLFKWAIRHELNLRDNEINDLKTDISLRFEQSYNYGPLVKRYFLDLINTLH